MDFADKPKEEQMKDWSNKEYLPSADSKLACVFVQMEEPKVASDVDSIVTANEEVVYSLNSLYFYFLDTKN